MRRGEDGLSRRIETRRRIPKHFRVAGAEVDGGGLRRIASEIPTEIGASPDLCVFEVEEVKQH